jgi:hypothetical protein
MGTPAMDRSYLRYLVAIAALTAAALFAAGERAAASEPDKVLSRSWNLESVDAPDTGIFTYCSTGIGYESRRVFYFIVDRFDRFSIGISDPAWNFEKGSHYPVTLFIDGRRIGEYELKGLTADMVTIGLPNTIRIVEGFKDGRQITAKFMGTTLAFELIGSRTALADLERCVAQGLARDEGATAEGPADPRAPGLRQNAQAVAPATTVRAPERVLSKSWGLRSKPSKIKGRSADCSVLALYETTRALAFFLNTHGRFALTIDSPD